MLWSHCGGRSTSRLWPPLRGMHAATTLPPSRLPATRRCGGTCLMHFAGRFTPLQHWHHSADFVRFACALSQAVMVHQLSKKATQNPFRKNKGRVVRVLFHPSQVTTTYSMVGGQAADQLHVISVASTEQAMSSPLIPPDSTQVATPRLEDACS